MQKTIKDVVSQCKMKNGVYILLCYESHYNNPNNQNDDFGIDNDKSLKSDIKSEKTI